MARKKAQIGIELMVIVGFMLLLMLPLIQLLLTKAGEFGEKVAVAKLSEDAGRIAGTADNVGRMGPGSNVTLQVDTPSGIADAQANAAGEIYFTVNTRFGQTEVVKMSSFALQMDSSLRDSLKRPGTHFVSVGYPIEGAGNLIYITGQ